jgi:hypothetical protein
MQPVANKLIKPTMALIRIERSPERERARANNTQEPRFVSIRGRVGNYFGMSKAG